MDRKNIFFLELGILILIVLLAGCAPQSIPLDDTVKETKVGSGIGDRAPDFTLNDLDSNEVSLADFKGKKNIVLNFWASWCPPCREEMPAFQQLHIENSDELVVLGANLQEKLEPMTKFIVDYGITYPILLDPESEVKRLYNVITQPVTYFINKEGIIVDKKFGPLTPEEVNEKVGKLIDAKPIVVQQSEDEINTLPDGTKYIIHPSKFMGGGPGKDGIPSIDSPRFLDVDMIDWLPDEEFGLGIVYKGEARFYPFRILVNHEIVNDFIQDDPILITYCPLCFTGISFLRELDGEAVEFGVSGKLYNSELIMYDRKTDSYWPQSLGKAVMGPSTGTLLKKLPTDTVLYGDWRKVHPDTLVLSKKTGFFRQYNGRNPYGEDGNFESIGLQFPLENEDSRLEEYEVVYGFEVNGAFKAYKRSDLAAEGEIKDTVGGENIIVTFNQDLKSARAKTESGEQIVVETLFWFAWAAFHPDTELYSP